VTAKLTLTRRSRGRRARAGELKAYWGYVDGDGPDFVFSRGEGVAKPDGHLLYGVLCGARAPYDTSFVKALEERGYDLTALRFSVQKRQTPRFQVGDLVQFRPEAVRAPRTDGPMKVMTVVSDYSLIEVVWSDGGRYGAPPDWFMPALRDADAPPFQVHCVECQRPVEESRESCVLPTCYTCLPPPAPFPVIKPRTP
jgi:hypothetical protein